MKKLIILILLSIFAFAGCKKENKLKKSPLPLNEYIQRTWSTTSEKKEYFDLSNTKLFEENLTPGVYFVMHSDGTIRVKDLQGKNTNGTYALSSSNGKNTITISLNGVAEIYELVSITDKNMTIRQEKTNQVYNDGSERIAAKLIHTMEFICPCH